MKRFRGSRQEGILNDQIVLCCFEFLPLCDLAGRAIPVCRKWRKVVESAPRLWAKLDFSDRPALNRTQIGKAVARAGSHLQELRLDGFQQMTVESWSTLIRRIAAHQPAHFTFLSVPYTGFSVQRQLQEFAQSFPSLSTIALSHNSCCFGFARQVERSPLNLADPSPLCGHCDRANCCVRLVMIDCRHRPRLGHCRTYHVRFEVVE